MTTWQECLRELMYWMRKQRAYEWFERNGRITGSFIVGLIFIILLLTVLWTHAATNRVWVVAVPEGTNPNLFSIASSTIVAESNLYTRTEGGTQYVGLCGNPSTRTIVFSNGTTAASWSNTLNNIDKYVPSGSSLTFQFETQTNVMDAVLRFTGYFGGGNVYIQGNTSETGASTSHTNQEVWLVGTNLTVYPILITYNRVNVTFRNIKLFFNSTNSTYGLYGIGNDSLIVRNNNFRGNGVTGTGYGNYYYLAPNTWCFNNTYENSQYAIGLQFGTIVLTSNTNGPAPCVAYGIYNRSGSVFREAGQPTGTVANISNVYGGQTY